MIETLLSQIYTNDNWCLKIDRILKMIIINRTYLNKSEEKRDIGSNHGAQVDQEIEK